MSACRACGDPILWTVTEAKEGKQARRMPLDATADGRPLEVDGGNIVLVGTASDRTPIARYVKAGRFRSHFASCPEAASFRKAKR